MIEDLKKIRALLPRAQKKALIILSFLLLIGMFFEILGLGILLPILTILLNPEQLSEVLAYFTIVDLTVFSYNEVMVFCLLSLFLIYIFQNIRQKPYQKKQRRKISYLVPSPFKNKINYCTNH